MSSETPPRAWSSSSPAAPKSNDSARRAARSVRAGARGDSPGPRSTANPEGLQEYRGYRCDCKQCEREYHGVKRREKHSEVGMCRKRVPREILERRAEMTVDSSGDPMASSPSQPPAPLSQFRVPPLQPSAAPPPAAVPPVPPPPPLATDRMVGTGDSDDEADYLAIAASMTAASAVRDVSQARAARARARRVPRLRARAPCVLVC